MNLNRATLAGILAILFWSTTIAFSRTLSEQLGPFTTGAGIYLLAGGLACLVTARKPGGLRLLLGLPRRYLLGCGALFVAYTILLYIAIGLANSRSQVIAVGLANYLWPSFTLLLALPLQRQKANGLLPLGIASGLGGTWLAIATNGVSFTDFLTNPVALLPVGLALIAALLWGGYSNLARRWGSKDGNGVPLFLLVSGLLFLPLRLITAEPAPQLWPVLPALVYISIFPGYIGYSLWDTAMQRGDLVLVTSLSYFTPLLSTMISFLVLQVPLTPQLGLAALLVTAGAALSRKGVPSP
jgi:drug/metabolite transporter (DMT)-like permease